MRGPRADATYRDLAAPRYCCQEGSAPLRSTSCRYSMCRLFGVCAVTHVPCTYAPLPPGWSPVMETVESGPAGRQGPAGGLQNPVRSGWANQYLPEQSGGAGHPARRGIAGLRFGLCIVGKCGATLRGGAARCPGQCQGRVAGPLQPGRRAGEPGQNEG